MERGKESFTHDLLILILTLTFSFFPNSLMIPICILYGLIYILVNTRYYIIRVRVRVRVKLHHSSLIVPCTKL